MNFLKSGVMILLLCILSGCAHRHGDETQPTAYRVVAQISVVCQNGTEKREYLLQDPEEMQQILNYLRWVDPYGAPEEDPMTQPGEEYLIVMHYSDGSGKTYRQRCDRYLRAGDGPWKKIAPERGRELRELLAGLSREGGLPHGEIEPTQPLLCPKLSRGSEIWRVKKSREE